MLVIKDKEKSALSALKLLENEPRLNYDNKITING